MDNTNNEIDIGVILSRGESPLSVVEGAMERLGKGEKLVLLVSFEPIPLYEQIVAWGGRYEVERVPGGYRIVVQKKEEAVELPEFVDLRKLRPEQVEARVLQAYGAMKKGVLIVHLEGELEEMEGRFEAERISWEGYEQTDGTYHLYLLKEEG